MQEKFNIITGYFLCVTYGNLKKTKPKIVATNFPVVLTLVGFVTPKTIPPYGAREKCVTAIFFSARWINTSKTPTNTNENHLGLLQEVIQHFTEKIGSC